MRSRPPIKAVQAFEAAARLSSFALAAEELFVTPSAISHQIKFLEEQFGVKLFHRIHRAVQLTDAGRRYAEEITAAFNRIDMATMELGRTAHSDILTVHSSPSFATQWLMPRLARFSSTQPDIDVRLNSTYPVPDNLLLQGVDIDIRYGMRRLQPAGTMVLPFPPETIVLANGEHPIRTVEDLQHHTLIHSEVCLVSWRDWLRQYRKVPLDISRGPRFDRSFMAITAAVDGMGVLLDSLLLVQRELAAGTLVAPLGMDGPRVQGYTFNVLRSQSELPKIRAFQDWLFQELERSGKSAA